MPGDLAPVLGFLGALWILAMAVARFVLLWARSDAIASRPSAGRSSQDLEAVADDDAFHAREGQWRSAAELAEESVAEYWRNTPGHCRRLFRDADQVLDHLIDLDAIETEASLRADAVPVGSPWA